MNKDGNMEDIKIERMQMNGWLTESDLIRAVLENSLFIDGWG